MSDPSITRLVVGAPRTLVLGVPVGQKVGAKKIEASWSAGRWLLHQGRRLAAPTVTKKKSFSIALSLPKGRSRKMLAFLVVTGLAIVATVAGVFLHMRKSEPAVPSPFGPAAAKATSLTVVEQPYVTSVEQATTPDQQQVPAFAQAATAPLPFPVTRLAGQLAPAVQPRPAQERPAQATETKAVKPAAVVLDEEAAQALTAKQALAPITKAQNTPSLFTAKPTAPERPAVAATPMAAARVTGLVAITPDGKVAVFTNPHTRMPEQFTVGDKLPSGDTVKAIDAQAGKVVTSSKEYGLE